MIPLEEIRVMEDLARKLEVWIREQVTGANCQGVVFGLSGGIDSSVVAILCKRAFPESVLAAMMPCFMPSESVTICRAL